MPEAAGAVSAAVTVRFVLNVVALSTARTDVEVVDATEEAATLNDALLAPATTVTVAGTLRAVPTLEIATAVAAVAAADIPTEHTVEPPAVSVALLHDRAARVGVEDGGGLVNSSGNSRATLPLLVIAIAPAAESNTNAPDSSTATAAYAGIGAPFRVTA